MITRNATKLGLLALLVSLMAIAPLASFGSHVTPTEHSGNPTCSSLGEGSELKVEPVQNGTFSDGTLQVTLTNVDGRTFNWSSNIGVDSVFVKGGPGGNLYSYDPESTGDTGLRAPDNDNNGGTYGLSHVSFCYDVETVQPSPSPSPSPSPTTSPSPTPETSPTPSPTPEGSPTPGPTTSPSPAAVAGTVVSAPSPASVKGVKVTAEAESKPAAVQAQRLPVTGMAVLGLLAVAAALLAVGILVQRRTRKNTETL